MLVADSPRVSKTGLGSERTNPLCAELLAESAQEWNSISAAASAQYRRRDLLTGDSAHPGHAASWARSGRVLLKRKK
jgi:hypothetical protein